jgi:hypothetical protein
MIAFKFTKQSEFRQAPISLDGVGRHVKDLWRLIELSPPKNRSSTTRFFLASMLAKASNARSNATTSMVASGLRHTGKVPSNGLFGGTTLRGGTT